MLFTFLVLFIALMLSQVIAAAQAGVHNSKRQSYGHSLVVDPWGTIVAKLEGGVSSPRFSNEKYSEYCKPTSLLSAGCMQIQRQPE